MSAFMMAAFLLILGLVAIAIVSVVAAVGFWCGKRSASRPLRAEIERLTAELNDAKRWEKQQSADVNGGPMR